MSRPGESLLNATGHAHWESQISHHEKSRARRKGASKSYGRSWCTSRRKRCFDIAVAVLVLVSFALPMLLIAICVKLSSRGKAIFIQERVGSWGKLFPMFKFRTMISGRATNTPKLTKSGDVRITHLGKWLRKFKLDELPQFYNVVRGEMSIVGPRPKVIQYAASEDLPYRPGITGPATIAFRREEELLNRFDDPREMDRYYKIRVMPLKARIDRTYMRNSTFSSDLRLILLTAALCLWPKRRARALRV